MNLNGLCVSVKEEKPGKVYVGNLLPGLYLLMAEVDNRVVVR